MRLLLGVTILTFATMSVAAAQSQKGPSKADEPDGAKHLLIDPYLTGTGATVDKPGVPQGSGTTKLDRQIQREDNKIDSSICKGCTK